jgi:serine/threonine protein kinase
MSSGRESINSERWAELKSLFDAAVERPPNDWPSLVGGVRARDSALADQLQRLLDGHADSLIHVRPRLEHLEPGAVLGPFVITGLIGEGGMGQVYRARDERLGRDVAVKVLPPYLADDPARRVRMEREARAMGMLNHPNIVTVHDVGDHHGSLFIVSELLEGGTLRERAAAGANPDGRLAARAAVEIVAWVGDALGAAHARGIVHRDIKPENVFLTSDGRIKVLDFGIAKLLDGEAGTGTATGTVVGTLAYMAPEQLRGEPVGAQTDVYACGVVLYELLSGARPFAGRSQPALIAAILHEEPPPLAGVAPELSALVARCLDKRPEARFADGSQLAGALRALTAVTNGTDDATREASTLRLQDVPRAADRPAEKSGWKRTRLVATVIALLAGLAIGGLVWRQQRDGAVPHPSPAAAKPDAVVAVPSATPPEAEARRSEPPSASRDTRSTAPRQDPQRPGTASTAPLVPRSTVETGPPPQTAAPPPPVVPSLDGIWTFTEQVAEDVHAIDCTASGALQLKAGDGVLDGTLRLKQDCRDIKAKTTDSLEAIAALTAGTITGDAVSFVTRAVNDDLATTCRYKGTVVGSSRGTMTGEVTCEARQAGKDMVLALRGTWRASRS